MADFDQAEAGGLAASYFRPPDNYFWQWAEQFEVIEWVQERRSDTGGGPTNWWEASESSGPIPISGPTITYREELAALLGGLAPDGLPPLGAVLLLLAACTEGWGKNRGGGQGQPREHDVLDRLIDGGLPNPPGAPPLEEAHHSLIDTLLFLDKVHELPAGLRQGIAKEHLLRTVLGAAKPRLPASRARAVLARLNPLETAALISGEAATLPLLVRDLRCFARAAERFPTVHSLELHLRTSLAELPAPLDEDEVPAPPPPADAPPADLLAELAQNPETAGLARLVPPLRAALRLPPVARRAAEQPLGGGVADLSNRGPLSRLLLSELAQDDLLLTARLANAEALYLRPEAPPQPELPPRVLLLDTTLAMWGVPRVLGLAAALALLPGAGSGQARGAGSQAKPPTSPPLAFALGGDAARPLALGTVGGVVAALGLLDPARHPAAALLALLPTLPAQAEALLITEAATAQHPDLRAALAASPAGLRFLLTVDRAGELTLYELSAGRRARLSTQQLNVNRLLFPARRKEPKPAETPALPAFLRAANCPLLLLPCNGSELLTATLCGHPFLGVVGISRNHRLLHFDGPDQGARELLPMVEEGEYYLALDGESAGLVYLLVAKGGQSANPRLIFYETNLFQYKRQRLDLSAQPAVRAGWVSIRYEAATFILTGPAGEYAFNCSNRTITADPPRGSRLVVLPHPLPFSPSNYSTLQRPSRLALSPEGRLVIGNRELVVGPDHTLRLVSYAQPEVRHEAVASPGSHQLTGNPRVHFYQFTWPDGSQALTDPRGLLHLRSADAGLPEVTLLLVLDRPTAAWAEGTRYFSGPPGDACVCGPTTFTGPDPPNALPAPEFYVEYLQPFLDQLARHQPRGPVQG